MNAIREETLSYYCNTNEHLLTSPPRGIVIEVPGLGGGSCLGGSMEIGPYQGDLAGRCAAAGLILAFVFIGPWTYMNKGAVRTCDEVVDVLRARYGLGEDSLLVAAGGSMGGLGSLIYTADSRHRVDRCLSACPCFDVPYYFERTPYRARAVYSSLAGYDMPMEQALRSISPAHRIGDMPRIPYFIVCDGADELFDAAGMELYAKALDDAVGGSVSFRLLPGVKHGGFVPEVWEELADFITA